jgi:hypothetical protein
MKKILAAIFVLTLLNVTPLVAQQPAKTKQFSVLFGLNQPIINQGFNIELNYWTKHFVFDYSHGFGLKFSDNLVSKEAKAQHLKFNISHSLGFGFGYRFTDRFNVRIEPKLHIWEMQYDNEQTTSQARITTYNTWTLGLGAYYRWMPFEKKQNLLKGITIAPSIRWWPNIATSLDNNEYGYFNTATGKNEIHEVNKIGIGNSPFFANVSIGYTFGRR